MPLALQSIFFRLPPYSATFDCDDAALSMSDRLQKTGIDTTVILGNLKLTDESYAESDHVWVVADIRGLELAFDRGSIYLDPQHYTGYVINRGQLLDFVAQDKNDNNQIASLPSNH
jgi:hypothetical protein